MPSFISNFEHNAAVPTGRWLQVAAWAVAAALVAATALEIGLRIRGYRPTALDAPELWSTWRERAAQAGADAFILVGASRMQLDIDLDVLRQEAGLLPFQLAIDGTSAIPVLRDLAGDDRIRGTVLVEYVDHVLIGDSHDAVANEWVQRHGQRPKMATAPSAAMESLLALALRQRMATFADGTTGASSLFTRLLNPHVTRQYLLTRHDRTRLADYSLVQMPQFELARALRHASLAPPPTIDDEASLRAWLATRIDETPPATLSPAFDARVEAIAADVATLQARGATVIFVRLPTSGLVRRYDEHVFPSQTFLAQFRARVQAPVLAFSDVPELGGFELPDGSHLDRRDRARFTRALLRAMHDRNLIPARTSPPP